MPVEIRASAFEGNRATNGGALRITNATSVLIRQTTFTRNLAADGGAADINMIFEPGAINVIDCTFESNEALSAGGALYLRNFAMENATVPITVLGTTFVGNQAENGGAIVAGGSANATLTIENSTFTKNLATDAGGAILSNSASAHTAIVIRNTVFEQNDAGGNGSALSSSEKSDDDSDQPAIVISGSSITTNGMVGGSAALHAARTLTLSLTDVDLGIGAMNNAGGDIAGCPKDYGAHTTGTVVFHEQAAPQCP